MRSIARIASVHGGRTASRASVQFRHTPPVPGDNGARRALVDFFYPEHNLAIEVDTAVLHSKPDSWVGNPLKERKVKRAIKAALPVDYDRLDDLFEVVKARHEYS